MNNMLYEILQEMLRVLLCGCCLCGFFIVKRWFVLIYLYIITGVKPKMFLAKLYKEIIELSEDDSLTVCICYWFFGYDASYSSSANKIHISPKWIIKYAKDRVDSISKSDIFLFTICHELGHHHYSDGPIFAFSKKSRMLSILREFRADNFAKNMCGYSGIEAYNLMERKIRYCKLKEKRIIYDHPKWKDRKEFLQIYDQYSIDFENAIKAKYGRLLWINSKKLNAVSLIDNNK